MNNFNDDLIKKASNQIGMSEEQLKNATKTNNINEILSHLSNEDAQKIKSILNNKKATEEFLKSNNTKNLLNNLFKNKG